MIYGKSHPRINERGKPHRTLYIPVKYLPTEEDQPPRRYPFPDQCHCQVWGREAFAGSSQCGHKATVEEVHKIKMKKGPGRPRLMKIPVCRIHSREYIIAKAETEDARYKAKWARSSAGWDVKRAGADLLDVLVRLTPAQVAELPQVVQEARSKYAEAMEARDGLLDEQDQEAREGEGDALDQHREATG